MTKGSVIAHALLLRFVTAEERKAKNGCLVFRSRACGRFLQGTDQSLRLARHVEWGLLLTCAVCWPAHRHRTKRHYFDHASRWLYGTWMRLVSAERGANTMHVHQDNDSDGC